MRARALVAVGIVLLAGARGVRELAKDADTARQVAEPYAPSQEAAPFLSVGYRELTADLMFARLTTYVGGLRHTANGVASLCEAIQALDAHHRRAYEWCALAIKTGSGVDERGYLRALALLERGMEVFPDDWRIPADSAPLSDDSLVVARHQLNEAVEELVSVLRSPDVVRSIPEVDRANLAKYLTIAKLKLENAIAVVRMGASD